MSSRIDEGFAPGSRERQLKATLQDSSSQVHIHATCQDSHSVRRAQVRPFPPRSETWSQYALLYRIAQHNDLDDW